MVQILPSRTFSGWRDWEYIPTTILINQATGAAVKFYKMSFGMIPDRLLPSSKFQIWSPTANCNLSVPWSTRTAFDALLVAGGSGTLIGAMTGVAIAGDIAAEKGVVNYSITSKDGYGPIVGYCLNNNYCERVYHYVNAIKNDLDGSTLIMASGIDVFQRYKLSRFILFHGLVENFYKGSDTPTETLSKNYLVSLGIEKMPATTTEISIPMSIYKKNGTSKTVTIKGFIGNGDAIIDPVTDFTIEVGDFYILDKPYFIEDPFLIGGLWRGTESDSLSTGETGSGYNLPKTQNQVFYTEAKVLGGYSLMDKDNKAKSFGVGQPMTDGDNDTWAWWLKDESYVDSDAYGQEKSRPTVTYSYVVEDTSAESNTKKETINVDNYIPTSSLRPKCTQADVLFGVNNGADHIRIELDRTGSFYRNNFHSPILQFEFVVQNSKYFKILAQVDAATIDVAYTSVDGTTKFSLDTKITILSQYAWKITEHFSDTRMVPYGQGIIQNIETEASSPTVWLKTYEFNMSSGTIGAVRRLNSTEAYPYLNPNSFNQRFISKYENSASSAGDLSQKGFGWVLVKEDGTQYFINKLVEVEEGTDAAGKYYVFNMELDNIPSSLVGGDKASLCFGEPYLREFINGWSTLENDNSRTNICLAGNWTSAPMTVQLPSNSVLGICDDYAWGLNGLITVGEGTIFFITTPEGFLSLSSFFTNTPYREAVLFSDYSTNKISLRSGAIDFTEYPVKEEIAMGHYAGEEKFSSSPLTLNKTHDRLNAINISLQKADSAANGFVTFATGEMGNYYGTVVSGKGQMNLTPLNDSGMMLFPEDVRSESNIVSPVYFYKKGFNSVSSHKLVPLGISTQKDNIYIQNSILVNENAPIDSGLALYINNPQTIDAYSGFDIFLMPDGEQIILFNKLYSGPVNINGKIFNDKSPEDAWKFSKSCIMATAMHGHMWGTPSKKDVPNATGQFSIPVMLANCCEYLCAVFSYHNWRFHIFAKCYNDDGIPFVGCFSINGLELFYSLPDDGMLFGKPKDSSATKDKIEPSQYKTAGMPFWFRSLRIGSQLSEPSFTYTATDNIPATGVEITSTADSFVRVYGPEGSSSKVQGDNFGSFSAKITAEGYIVLFIDTSEGLSFVFSHDSGQTWNQSFMVLAANGKNGFMIDDEAVYYSVQGEGLYEKSITSSHISRIIYYVLNSEGNDAAKTELKKSIDSAETISLGTGPLNSQKFCGHVTDTGARKIFFYDKNTYLSCIQSTKKGNWTISDNF